MSLRIVKLEDYGRWAVIDSVYEAMLRLTFSDEVEALLFVAWVDRAGMKHDDKEQSRIAGLLRVWLDELAPRRKGEPLRRELGGRVYVIPGEERDRILPEKWIKALTDTSYWDEEEFTRPVEDWYSEDQMIEDLWSNNRAAEVSVYLLDQFSEWYENRVKK